MIPTAQNTSAVRIRPDYNGPCQELGGTAIAARTVPGFQVVERQYTPGLRLPRHRHDNGYLIYGLEGVYTESYGAGGGVVCAPGPAAPRWLRVAREYAETNFLRTLSLAEIAGAAGVHRVHLAREFRRHFSVTVGEFLRGRRVEHACRLVSTTNDPLADVAIACGFSDQSHFCATFRRQVGLTPGRFREMAQSR